MATRFYLPAGGTAPASPAADTGVWEDVTAVTTNGRRWPLVTTPTNTTLTAPSVVGNQATQPKDYLLGQWVSLGLPAAKTIGGTVSLVVRLNEHDATTDSFMHVLIRVVSADGSTVRGTLLDSIDATEMATTLTTRIISAASLTPVAASAGDRIVVEIGHRETNTRAVNLFQAISVGDPFATADFALTAGLTTSLLPWVEFSDDGLVPTAPTARASVPTYASATTPDTSFTINAPTGLTAGDLILWVMSGQTATNPATAPTGFTLWASGTTTGLCCSVYQRIADGSEGSTFTSSALTSSRWSSAILAIPGADVTTPADVSFPAANAGTTAHTFPAITPVTAGATVFAFGAESFSAGAAGSTVTSTNLTIDGQTVTVFGSGVNVRTIGGHAPWIAGAFTPAMTQASTMTRTLGLSTAVRPSTGVTGTMATTLDDSTMAASGGESISGTLASTLDDSTLVAAGTETLTGVLAATLGDATMAATGTQTVAGTLTATLDDAALSAAGTETLSGTLATTLDDAVLAATGSQSTTITGTLAAILEDATMAAAGTESIDGTAALTLDDAAMAAAGVQTITGEFAVELDGATLEALAEQTITGILAATLDDAVLVSRIPPRDVKVISVTERGAGAVTVVETPRPVTVTARGRVVTVTDRSE